jgi:hypothetical protein
MIWHRGDRVIVPVRHKRACLELRGEIVAFGLIREEIEGAIVRFDRGTGRPLPPAPGCRRSTHRGMFPLAVLRSA